MNIFRVLSILLSVVFVILLIISLNVETSVTLKHAIVIVGIATAIFNVISTIMWWIADVANEYNSNQLRWFRISHR
jgi:hypothetical protein